MAQVVNASVLGLPASDTNGNPINWSLIIKADVYPLDYIGNTGILGIAGPIGYGATLPFTPSGPTDLLSTALFLDAPSDTLYAPSGTTPELADLSETSIFLNGATLYAATPPEPADIGTPTVFISAELGGYATPGSVPS